MAANYLSIIPTSNTHHTNNHTHTHTTQHTHPHHTHSYHTHTLIPHTHTNHTHMPPHTTMHAHLHHTYTHISTHTSTHTHTPQEWALTSKGKIKQHSRCLAYQADRSLYLSHCTENAEQQFELMPTGQLKYKPTGECLKVDHSLLKLVPCQEHDLSLEWDFVLATTTTT